MLILFTALGESYLCGFSELRLKTHSVSSGIWGIQFSRALVSLYAGSRFWAMLLLGTSACVFNTEICFSQVRSTNTAVVLRGCSLEQQMNRGTGLSILGKFCQIAYKTHLTLFIASVVLWILKIHLYTLHTKTHYTGVSVCDFTLHYSVMAAQEAWHVNTQLGCHIHPLRHACTSPTNFLLLLLPPLREDMRQIGFASKLQCLRQWNRP